MENLVNIIKLCDNAIDFGNISDKDLVDVLEFTRSIAESICNFTEEYGFDWTDYPMEYFERSVAAREGALETFSEILEIVEDF